MSSSTSSAIVGAGDRRHGKAASRSGRGSRPDGEPATGDREARPELVGPVGDGRGQHDPGGAGRERELDRLGGIEAARELQGHGAPRRDGADRFEADRLAGPRALEVDQVDEPRTLGDEPLDDPFRPIRRRAGPLGSARPIDHA